MIVKLQMLESFYLYKNKNNTLEILNISKDDVFEKLGEYQFLGIDKETSYTKILDFDIEEEDYIFLGDKMVLLKCADGECLITNNTIVTRDETIYVFQLNGEYVKYYEERCCLKIFKNSL